MFFSFDIGIFGGDLRQIYMIDALLKRGYRIAVYGICKPVTHNNCKPAYTLHELFENCRVLIAPIPISRDQVAITSENALSDLTIAHMAYLLKKQHILIGGNIPAPITELCNCSKILYYDLMKDEKIAIKNAVSTAEGTIMEAISSSDCNLHGSSCLVLGYGRCARILAQKLKAMDALVTVAARSKEALAYIEAVGHQSVSLSKINCILPSYHFIFNTIPALILDKDRLELVNPHAVIIDIASAPGGVDFTYAKQHRLNVKSCLGLPGKVSPRSTADILVNEIHVFMKEVIK
jgi:dipicolinate synthase subunit A